MNSISLAKHSDVSDIEVSFRGDQASLFVNVIFQKVRVHGGEAGTEHEEGRRKRDRGNLRDKIFWDQ